MFNEYIKKREIPDSLTGIKGRVTIKRGFPGEMETLIEDEKNIVTIGGQTTLKSGFTRSAFYTLFRDQQWSRGNVTISAYYDISTALEDDALWSNFRYLMMYNHATYIPDYLDKYPPYYDIGIFPIAIDQSGVIGKMSPRGVDAGSGLYGTLNKTESYLGDDSVKIVVDFNTGQAVGEITHLSFMSSDNTQYGTLPAEVVSKGQVINSRPDQYYGHVTREWGTEDFFVVPQVYNPSNLDIFKYTLSNDNWLDTGINMSLPSASSSYYIKDCEKVGNYLYYSFSYTSSANDHKVHRLNMTTGALDTLYEFSGLYYVRGITFNGTDLIIQTSNSSGNGVEYHTLSLDGLTLTLLGSGSDGVFGTIVLDEDDGDTLYVRVANTSTGRDILKLSLANLTLDEWVGNNYFNITDTALDVFAQRTSGGYKALSVYNGELYTYCQMIYASTNANYIGVAKFRQDVGNVGTGFKLSSPIVHDGLSPLKVIYELIYDV